jgi:hypothetical protein
MHDAILQFRSNIARVRALGGLYAALLSLTTPALDATDILRAQIVLAVSALDHYIHELARLGMIEVYTGLRPATNGFSRFHVRIDAAMRGIAAGIGSLWFEEEIRDKHKILAFQDPDKIADAIRLFSSCELWPTVAINLHISAQDVKTRLRLIIERRNKIAHEADLDPSYPGVRWPITAAETENVIKFIEDVCEQIYVVV